MNKILSIIKNLLLIFITCLFFVFVLQNGILRFEIWLFIIGLFDLIILNIKDCKNKISADNRYQILQIITFLVIIVVLNRSLFDQSLIIDISNVKEVKSLYFSQNINLFLILFALLHIYHFIVNEVNKKIHKYSFSSIIYLVINIIFFQYTLELFVSYLTNTTFPLLFFALNTILLVVEIVSLIKHNGVKKEWPIYICFLFNLFAYIAMFI
ncbi:MAG: hypothetical protein E7173_00100 [Firmicutes bacterium]|nr:hypothetical protein [Bacillota bacterium]